MKQIGEYDIKELGLSRRQYGLRLNYDYIVFPTYKSILLTIGGSDRDDYFNIKILDK